jgi:tetratricopeptide (TPR) repeat protein
MRSHSSGGFIAAAVVTLCVTAPSGVEAAGAGQQPVTFTRDVAPIIFANCTPCHRPGEAAPFSLLTYEDARRHARQIAETTGHGYMPPWQPEADFGEFEGERRLSPREIEVLGRWVADGAPEGDPRHLPKPPEFTPGWHLGPPDLVVTMAEPYHVPADGPDAFRNFVLPVPLKTRRYVTAIEFRPGNSRVVHHARVLIDDTHEARRLAAQDQEPGFEGMDAPGARFPDGHFLGWAPGKLPGREPLAWALDPGTDLVVQVHLKPTGRPEPVQASIGLYLTDRPPADAPVMLRMGSRTIDIPAGHPRYEIVDSYTMPVDVRALKIYPHAHYLGREMTVTVRLPDGTTSGLLHILEWDFNWQDEYVYAHPVDLPKGSTLTMRYTFDNSGANTRNPFSPPRRVRSGPATTDEMGELLVQLLPKKRSDLAVLRADVGRKTLLLDTAGEEKRVTDDPGDHEARNSLGVLYMRLGRHDEALEQFQQALRIAPDHAVAHYNIAVIRIADGALAEARQHLESAIAARPDYPEAHTNLGVTLERLGHPAEAQSHYRAAIAAKPEHAAARANLGRMLLQRGAIDAAIEHFEAIIQVQPSNASVLDALAAAYAATGRQANAVRTAQKAFEAAMAAHDDELARAIRGRLESYQQPPD